MVAHDCSGRKPAEEKVSNTTSILLKKLQFYNSLQRMWPPLLYLWIIIYYCTDSEFLRQSDGQSSQRKLECVDIVRENVKEETEVVPCGHGCIYMKNEKTEETDTSKNAEDPIQDSSESDDEDRERRLVHTTNTTFSWKKEQRGQWCFRKGKADKDNSTKSNPDFEKRCNQLLHSNGEFGHCNISTKYSGNLSLGGWCSHMRT